MSNRKLKGGNLNLQFDPNNFNLRELIGLNDSKESAAKGGNKAKKGGNPPVEENFADNQNMEGGKGKKTRATPKPKASPRVVRKTAKGGAPSEQQQNNKSAGGEHGAFSDNTYKTPFKNDGGLNVAPFISALALLGTRLLSDKNLMKNNSLNFLNSKKESPKKRSKKSSSSGGALKGGFEDPAAPAAPAVEAEESVEEPVEEPVDKKLGGGRKPKASRKPKTPSSPKAKKPKASRK